MSWRYGLLYAEMFVTSPPFIVAAGLFFALGLLAGRWIFRGGHRRTS